MSENGVMSGTMSMPDTELLKVLVDKMIDHGTVITEAREQIRKLVVQGEEKEGVLLQLERIDQRFKGIEKSMALDMEAMKVKMEAYERKMDPDRLIAGIGQLQRDLVLHTEYFSQPRRKEVHYKHFVGWPIRTLFAAWLVACLLGFLWLTAREKAERYEDNAIKWRYARLLDYPAVTDALDSTERHFQADPVQFRTDVNAEEERQKELTERVRQMRENNSHIEELQRQKKK